MHNTHKECYRKKLLYVMKTPHKAKKTIYLHFVQIKESGVEQISTHL